MQREPDLPKIEHQEKIGNQTIRKWFTLSKVSGRFGALGGVLLANILLIIILSFLSKYFFTATNITNILRQSAPLAMVAIGITIVIISGGIDLSVASSISLTSVLLTIFLTELGLPLSISLILVFLIGIALGVFNGVLITIFKIPPIIATLSSSIVFSGIAYTITQGYSINLPIDSAIKILGGGKIWQIPISMLIVVVVYIITQSFLKNTGFGRIVYGLGGNTEAVFLSGISVKKYTMLIYMLCGFFTTFASVLLTARVANGHPNNGGGMEMDAIAAVVLGGTSIFGGMGNLWGTLVGVLTMTIIVNGLTLLNINPYIQLIVKGLVIAAAVGVTSIRISKR
jgi:ribose/xylose/arabinose/galactoside ABC-type transport system permease subunit